MDNYDYDLFVIGAGSGGVRAARMAAGWRKGGDSRRPLHGGHLVSTWVVYRKKLYVYASEFSKSFSDARNYGWDSETGFPLGHPAR